MKTISKYAVLAAAALLSTTAARAEVLTFNWSGPAGVFETFNLDTNAGQLSQFSNLYIYPITNDTTGSDGFFFGETASNGYSGSGQITGNQVDSVNINAFFTPAIFTGVTPIAFAPGQSFIGTGSTVLSVSAGPVPEPATWALMLAGFGGLGALARGRRRVAATA